MQLGGEGVCGIHDKPDVMAGAKVLHLTCIHAPGNTGTVFTLDLLRVAFGRVVIGGACLVEYPGCCSAFCCSAEYEDHDIYDLRFMIYDL